MASVRHIPPGGKPADSRPCNTRSRRRPEPPRPSHCEDSYLARIGEVHDDLFGRWPDAGGARYWTDRLRAEGVPGSCWEHEITHGTRGSDCARHRARHGVTPQSNLCSGIDKGYSARGRRAWCF